MGGGGELSSVSSNLLLMHAIRQFLELGGYIYFLRIKNVVYWFSPGFLQLDKSFFKSQLMAVLIYTVHPVRKIYKFINMNNLLNFKRFELIIKHAIRLCLEFRYMYIYILRIKNSVFVCFVFTARYIFS